MHPKEPKFHAPRALGEILLEAFMIVLSILLALGLENWNEHRKETARCREALRLIREELVQNRNEMSGLVEGHRKKSAELMRASETMARGAKCSVRADVSFASHNSSAFDVATAGRALNELDYRTLLALNECHTSHEWLEKMENMYFQLVLDVNREENRVKVARQLQLVSGLLDNYVVMERQTLQQYDSASVAIDLALGTRGNPPEMIP